VFLDPLIGIMEIIFGRYTFFFSSLPISFLLSRVAVVVVAHGFLVFNISF